MEKKMFEDHAFDNIDYTTDHLKIAEYDRCRFSNCKFSETNFSNITFIECEFDSCDLSMVKLTNTTFNDVEFKNCKMLGMHFQDCNQFVLIVGFKDCLLNLSSFYQLRLKSTKFISCSLHELDLASADLSGSTFDNCDLRGAMFENTNLEKVDLRSSYNYSIDPDKNKIKKARFAMPGLTGLLHKYDIILDI